MLCPAFYACATDRLTPAQFMHESSPIASSTRCRLPAARLALVARCTEDPSLRGQEFMFPPRSVPEDDVTTPFEVEWLVVDHVVWFELLRSIEEARIHQSAHRVYLEVGYAIRAPCRGLSLEFDFAIANVFRKWLMLASFGKRPINSGAFRLAGEDSVLAWTW